MLKTLLAGVGAWFSSVRLWVVIGALLGATLATWYGIQLLRESGAATERAACNARLQQANERIRELERFNAAAGRVVETHYITRQVQQQLTDAQRLKEGQAYVQTHPEQFARCGLDAVGLRQWNTANAGAPELQPAAEPGRGVPGAAAGIRRAIRDALRQPPAGGAGGGDVPGAARGAGGVGAGELPAGAH